MKTIIITGANSGIGKEAALILAKAGHQIIMLCRDSEKSVQARAEIVAQSGNQNVDLIPVDLAEMGSIETAVSQIKSRYPKIDVLINNAGVFKARRTETTAGIEMTFAVNFLAPFLLSQLLLERLGENGRIVNVSSELYKNGTINFDDLMMKNKYKAGDAYANSKLASALNAIELAKQVRDQGVTVNSLHPGVLATNSFRDYSDFLMKIVNLFLEKPQKGGERIAYLATSDDVSGITGSYFYKIENRGFDISGKERDKSEQLWQISKEMCGIVEKRLITK